MLRNGHGEISKMGKELLQLDGADLQWWQLSIAYGSLVLKIVGLTSETAYLSFVMSADYVDMPFLMHNVRLRVATQSSMDALLQRLNPEQGPFGELLLEMSWKEIIHITCAEGEYFLQASSVDIHVGAIPSVEALQKSKSLIQASGVDPTSEAFWREEPI